MIPDARFICSSDLQGVFLDQLTGLPLAAGPIDFYSDINRTTLKPVYSLTGAGTMISPYAFVPLTDPIFLNSVGGYEDGSGNSIVIYYFPFQGLPSDNNPNTELYYITVFNSGSQQQFVRQAWPQLAVNLAAETNVLIEDITNQIPNGQFLFYNFPITAPIIGTNLVYMIAQGGWSFRQTNGSSGVYALNFVSTLGGATNLLEFPSNAIEISRGAKGNEIVYELFIQWPDVNTFSTVGSITPFNLLCAIKSNDALAETLGVSVVQNFGGADTDHYTSMSNISVTSDANFNYYNTTINFPDNTGVPILGSGSYVGIAITMPATAFDLIFTDFALTITSTPLKSFPPTSPDQILSRGISGNIPIPDPAGMDLYLPLILTPSGMTWDTGQIGKVEGSLNNVAPFGNCLPMDGGGYLFSGYSTIAHQSVNGIPFKRLGNFLTNVFASYTPTAVFPLGCGIPLFGSGVTFINAYGVTSHTNEFLLVINAGSGVSPIPAVGTAPVTLTTSSDPDFTFTLNSVPTAGEYFTFSAPVVSPVSYYVWFSVNGVGPDPAPGGIGIQVKVVTGDTVATTVVKILYAINQYLFATFNLAGYFLRGFDATGIIDPNYATRVIAGLNSLTGAFLGSTEVDAFKAHNHTGTSAVSATTGSANAAQQGNTGTSTISLTIANNGGLETRPVNFALNWFIRY